MCIEIICNEYLVGRIVQISAEYTQIAIAMSKCIRFLVCLGTNFLRYLQSHSLLQITLVSVLIFHLQ